MHRIVVVDDEEKIVKTICSFINDNLENVEIVGTANSAQDGIQVINTQKPDLLLLDIEMPFANGFDMLELIPDRDFDVIFVTAYNQYAINAIKVNALDYILKPIDVDELVNAIQKSKQKKNANSQMIQVNNLLNDIYKKDVHKIKILTKTGIEFISIGRIIKVEADGNYSNIFLEGTDSILSSLKIKQIEEVLPKAIFFRSHKSFIVNLEKVLKYNTANNSIIMLDDTEVVLSRSKRKDFLDKMEQFLLR